MQQSLGKSNSSETSYWITPVRSSQEVQAEKIIQNLVGKGRMYAFMESTKARSSLKVGDWLCFYATRKGIVGYAQVVSDMKRNSHSDIIDPQTFPWIVYLDNIKLYVDKPLALDENVRQHLDAFTKEKRQYLSAFSVGSRRQVWAWFVHTMHKVSEHDFKVLTQDETIDEH